MRRSRDNSGEKDIVMCVVASGLHGQRSGRRFPTLFFSLTMFIFGGTIIYVSL